MKTFVHAALAAFVALVSIASVVLALAFPQNLDVGPVLCSVLLISPLAFGLLLFNALTQTRE